jgi:hypothetical protein
MEPLAITLSALPDAPVLPVKTPRHRSQPFRRATASTLHHLADLVEPRIA